VKPLRNSLGLNYESAALTQLSYAGAAEYEFHAHAGLAAARERGAKLGPPRTLDRPGMSGRKIAAKLNVPVGSVFAVLKKATNGQSIRKVST
jgi:hypothetical protein